MDETQSLATLRKIEKLLEMSLAIGRQDQLDERNQSRRKPGKKEEPSLDLDNLNRQVIRATARMKQLSEQTDKLGKTTRNVRVDLVALRSGVRSAVTSTKGFDSALGKVSDTVIKSSALTTDTLKKEIELNREAEDATSSSIDATRRHTQETRRSGRFFGGMLDRLAARLGATGDKADWVKTQLVNLGWSLVDLGINITKDVFSLQARGISASQSLIELYGNAIKAGMSLEEYTSMLQDNSAAVIRARSFSEFGDSIDKTTRELNRLGAFGPAAEQLAASLRTSATTLGINVDSQDAAASAQVKIFERLRKTTLMTADAFRELQVDIASNQMVQEQLLGMAPAERAARLRQITEGATVGYQLGATAQASKQLQEALLAQRRSTVQDRFKAAGTIRMGGAILGMDTSRVEEYARLMLKNPALRTAEDKKRIASLAGDYQQFLQALKNSPNPALENIADQLAAIAPAVQSELQSAAGAVKAQQQAGEARLREAGQETSEALQAIGRGFTALSGFMKNPLADALVIFGSILAQTVVQSSLLALIAKNTGSFKGLTQMFSKGGKGRAAGAAGKAGLLSKFGAFFATTLGSVASIDLTGRRQPGEIRERGIGARISAQNEAQAAKKAADASKAVRGGGILSSILSSTVGNMFGMGALNSLNFSATGDLIPDDAKRGFVSKIGDGLKSSFGKIFGIFKTAGPLSMIFGAIEEMFTGEMAAGLGFGDDLGGRLLGMVTGGLNSFATGLSRMFDGLLNWVLEGLGINFKVNFTKLFDAATIIFTMGARTILSAIARVASDIIGFFSKDAPWAKSLRKFSDEQDEKTLDNIKTLNKLWTTEGATLRSIGEEQVKATKKAADKSKEYAQATVDNVVMGTNNLMPAARSTASTMASTQPAQSTTVALPQPTPQPKVTPPEVNRAQVERERARDSDTTGSSELTLSGMQELISNTQQQLDVLKQLLALSTRNGSAGDVLPAMPRPEFADNTQFYNQIVYP